MQANLPSSRTRTSNGRMRAVQREWTNNIRRRRTGNAVFAKSPENLSGRKCQGRVTISSVPVFAFGRTRARSLRLVCLLFLGGIWNNLGGTAFKQTVRRAPCISRYFVAPGRREGRANKNAAHRLAGFSLGIWTNFS